MAAPDTRKRRAASRAPATNGGGRANGDTVELSKQDLQELLNALRAASRSNGRQAKDGTVEISRKDLKELVDALRSARDGELSVRLSEKSGAMGDVAKAYNQLADRREGLTRELGRVSKVIGREGRMTERAQLRGAKGSWAGAIGSVNSMIEDLVRPTIEVGRVLDAVADGDL